MNRKSGVFLSYLMMIFEVLSTLLLTPFIIRTIGQAEYGVYKLSAAITAYLLLLDLGIGNAVIKYAAQYNARKELESERKLLGVTTLFFGLIAFIVLIIGIALVFLFPVAFSQGLNSEEIRLGQKLLCITVINAAVTLGTTAYINFITAHERFVVVKGVSIIQIIIRVFLSYIVLIFNMGSLGIVAINLLMTIVFRGFFVFYVIFALKIKPQFKELEFSFIKGIIIYSIWIFIQAVATQINSFVDQVLIGIVVPASTIIIGIYGIGAQIIQYYQSIGSAVTGVLMPGVVKMVELKADSQVLCNEMIRIGRLIFVMLSIVFICFAIYGKQFLGLWVGADNEESFYVTIVLMPIYLFIITESIGAQILWAKNEHKEQAILKLFIVLSNIVLTYFLIMWKPLLGATIGTAISLFFGDIVVMNVIFKKKLQISLKRYYYGLFKGIVPSLFFSLVSGYCFSLLNLNGWIGFVCNILSMVVVYITCLLVFGFNEYERKLLKNIIFRVFKKKNIKI